MTFSLRSRHSLFKPDKQVGSMNRDVFRMTDDALTYGLIFCLRPHTSPNASRHHRRHQVCKLPRLTNSGQHAIHLSAVASCIKCRYCCEERAYSQGSCAQVFQSKADRQYGLASVRWHRPLLASEQQRYPGTGYRTLKAPIGKSASFKPGSLRTFGQ
jgi:hypothetical protein